MSQQQLDTFIRDVKLSPYANTVVKNIKLKQQLINFISQFGPFFGEKSTPDKDYNSFAQSIASGEYAKSLALDSLLNDYKHEPKATVELFLISNSDLDMKKDLAKFGEFLK